MSKIFHLAAPQLGANDETLKVVEWLFAAGDNVQKGQVVALVETTKATSEIESDFDGYFYPLVDANIDITISETLAVISTTPVPDSDIAALKIKDQSSKREDPFAAAGVRLTKKAFKLAVKLGIDPKQLAKDRILKESDVLAVTQTCQIDHGRKHQQVLIYKIGNGSTTILETIQAMGGYEVVGFLSKNFSTEIFLGLPVYPFEQIEDLRKKGVNYFIAGETDRQERIEVLKEAEKAGFQLFNAIHPRASISPSVRLAGGNHIKACAVIETGTIVGMGCIIDNGAIVPHHNIIGDGCHISPGVAMGSSIQLGMRVLLGIGACVSTGVDIGNDVIVSPGSSVTKNVPDGSVLEGVPARIIGKRNI